MSQLLGNKFVKARRELTFQQPPLPVRARRQYDQEVLQRALDATRHGMSAYRASRVFGVPETTIKDRRLGNVEVGANPGPDRIFSETEEKQLVEHVKYMASIGYGYTKANVQYIAFDFAVTCGKRDASDKQLSNSWFYAFLKRWPDLKLAKPQKLSMQRAQCASREVLNKYFKELATILTVNGLHDKPERIYNIDETGINTEHVPPRVLCDIDTQAQAVTSPRSSTVTIIGAGNAAGNHIPPYYIFPAKRWNDVYLQGAPPGSSGEMSKTGWSNKDVFYKYLTTHFVRHAGITEDKTSPSTLVLFDGHKSHVSLTLIEWAKKHNVILFVLPPHTSHITQPLDVGVFGPLKSIYYRECQSYLQKNPGKKITIYDVAKLTSRPYLKALSPENLQSAFKKSGIYPYSNKTVDDAQVAPSTIYQNSTEPKENSIDETETDKENNRLLGTSAHLDVSHTENVGGSPRTEFFKYRTITSVVKKPKKKFVPPFLAGSLSKKKNVDILQSTVKNSKTTVNKQHLKSTCTIKKSFQKNSIDSCSKKPVKKGKVRSGPQPGPSAYQVDNTDSEPMSLSENETEDESSNCCVCGDFSPPALRDCVQLFITKWAECSKCGHWTHLQFCTDIRVVRRHGVFLCPNCE